MPKPPPTSPTTTRTFSLGRPMAAHSESRTPEGICVLMRIVRRPVSLSCAASTERGSMVSATTRWLFTSSATTWLALAKAAVAASLLPWRISAATLPEASSHNCGAPSAVALARSTTIGRSS